MPSTTPGRSRTGASPRAERPESRVRLIVSACESARRVMGPRPRRALAMAGAGLFLVVALAACDAIPLPSGSFALPSRPPLPSVSFELPSLPPIPTPVETEEPATPTPEVTAPPTEPPTPPPTPSPTPEPTPSPTPPPTPSPTPTPTPTPPATNAEPDAAAHADTGTAHAEPDRGPDAFAVAQPQPEPVAEPQPQRVALGPPVALAEPIGIADTNADADRGLGTQRVADPAADRPHRRRHRRRDRVAAPAVRSAATARRPGGDRDGRPAGERATEAASRRPRQSPPPLTTTATWRACSPIPPPATPHPQVAGTRRPRARDRTSHRHLRVRGNP